MSLVPCLLSWSLDRFRLDFERRSFRLVDELSKDIVVSSWSRSEFKSRLVNVKEFDKDLFKRLAEEFLRIVGTDKSTDKGRNIFAATLMGGPEITLDLSLGFGFELVGVFVVVAVDPLLSPSFEIFAFCFSFNISFISDLEEFVKFTYSDNSLVSKLVLERTYFKL